MTRLRFRTPAACALTFASLLAPAAFADDRDVLRDSTTKPYVFVILDTSGSMNWSPACSQADYDTFYDHDNDTATPDIRRCNFVCEPRDCPVPRDGDDPNSKFRQAKEALYEVIRTVDDLDFGFATYNQDNLRVTRKHWLYRVSGAPGGAFTLSGGIPFPEMGSEEVFGADWWDAAGGTCTYAPNNYNDDTTDTNIGCFPRKADGSNADSNDCENGGGSNTNVCAPADTNNAWEYTKFRRLPRLDTNGNTLTYLYLRVPNGERYRIKYGGPVTYGDATITVPTEVARCTNSKCTTTDTPLVRDIQYTLVGDFVMWDFAVDRTPPQNGYNGQQYSGSDQTCEGWEPNDDRNIGTDDGQDDDWVDGNGNTGQLKRPNKTPLLFDPTGSTNDWRFEIGDVVPQVWSDNNKLELLNRLAPRLNGADPASDPEAFANATYLNNNRSGTQQFLSRNAAAIAGDDYPLIPSGSTPLGASLRSFRNWYRGCNNATPGCNNTGWDDFAAVNDPKWGCRQKFILFLTDGDETCNGDPCGYTDVLHDNDGVSTYVVAFGVANTGGNQLNCMAANGGTGEPIYPQNKQELIDALRGIFSEVREQAAAFASAAVPQVQASATDKIFLSSFTPLNDASYWAGRMDAFLKPLPLDVQGRPDRSVECSGSVQSRCFLWDAGDVQDGQFGGGGTYDPQGLLVQAPHPDDVAPAPPWDAADLQLGAGADERRLLYSQFSEAGNRRLFTYPTNNSERYDLWSGLGLSFVVGDATSEAAAELTANRIIVETLLEKEGTVDVPDPANPGAFIQSPITYLLGDIFHADPAILSRPSNSNYYNSDPYIGKRLCAADPDPDRLPPISYRWFADRHFCRRSVLFTAANDGQLHAFDAGIFEDAGHGLECLLPAKDADGDGIAELDEFADGVVDYDVDDDVQGNQACASDADCGTGPCAGGFCRDVLVGVVDGAYDNGSGREVFSFVPRAMLPTVTKMANDAKRNTEFWGMDSGPRIDDVFIDPLASDTGSVTCLGREWRTVAVGGYREGGPGYYALDLTQPDTLDGENVPEPANGYVPSCLDGGSDCGNRPYPAVLWEFQDRQTIDLGSGSLLEVDLDEDLNDQRDLGNSWSKATTGRIRVCTGTCGEDETEDRFVAIFGGGLADDPVIARGNYIYMVDIETGKTIYKKLVIGSVPGDVAAVDFNGDTYIDRLYFGTTAGFLYKVQLETSPSSPMLIESIPNLKTRYAGNNYELVVERITGPTGDEDRYDPFQVFSTGGRSIYHEISAIYVASKNRVAMAFGTGNRWDLWDFDSEAGRFYMLLDDDFQDIDRDGVLDISCSGCTEPLTESKYVGIAPGAAGTSTPLLYEGQGTNLPGWYLTLEADERVITEAFSLSGITSFTSFVPTEVPNANGTCSRAGSSRIFIVGTVTANGYVQGDRFTEIPQFTTPLFVEQSATKNPEGGGSGTGHADVMTDALRDIRDELKTLQSTRCKYANYTQNIKTIRSDTGVVFVAPIPICIDPTSWKEF